VIMPVGPVPAGYVMLDNAWITPTVIYDRVFCGSVRVPSGKVKYFASVVDKQAALRSETFWQEFWTQLKE